MQNTEKDRWAALFAAVTWGFTMWSRTSFAYYAPELEISAKASMLYGGGCMAVILVLICFLQETASIKKNLPHEKIV